MHIGALLQIKQFWLCTALDNGVDCCCTRLLDLSHARILALLFVCQYGCLASYHDCDLPERNTRVTTCILTIQFMSVVRDIEYVELDN